MDAVNPSNQSTKAIEHNDCDDCHTRKWQATYVACGGESIKSCQTEGEDKTDGQRIQHPDISRHHLMHDSPDAIDLECLVQSEQAANVANGYKELEHCSES